MRETERERARVFAGVPAAHAKTKIPLCSSSSLAFKSSTSDFVVDVGRALRGHLLNYVDRVAVVAADLLVVRAEDAVSSPERDDDVAGLRAIIVPTASAPLGRGQGAEGQRGCMLRRVLAMPPPVLEQQQHQHDDDDDENDAARSDANEDGDLRANDAGGLPTVVVIGAFSVCYTWTQTEAEVSMMTRLASVQPKVTFQLYCMMYSVGE